MQRTFIKEKCRKGKRRRRRICRRIRNEFYWGRRFSIRRKTGEKIRLCSISMMMMIRHWLPFQPQFDYVQHSNCKLKNADFHRRIHFPHSFFLSVAESLFLALNVRSPGLWTAFADETEVGNKLAIAAGGVNVRKGRTKKGGRHKQERQTQHFTPRS